MTYAPKNAVVWMELPTRNMEKAVKFYNAVFDYGLTIDSTGPNPMAMLPSEGDGVAGHIYPGTPPKDGSGPTIHFAVPGKLEDSMASWTKAGGTILSPAISIPPGRFAYGTDLDGNSIGLFEPAAG